MNSIYNQWLYTDKLIRILKDYSDNLKYHAIVKPKETLDEGLRNGLPIEVYNTYLGYYHALNEQDATGIIAYIEGSCIPYLEGVREDLHKAMTAQ